MSWSSYTDAKNVPEDVLLPELPLEMQQHDIQLLNKAGNVYVKHSDEDPDTMELVTAAQKMVTMWNQERLFIELPVIAEHKTLFLPTEHQQSLHRYTNIMPYLEQLEFAPDKTVINASTVTAYHIAGQAPTKEGIEQFWWYLWDNRVSIIVMLTPLDPKKADQYWPNLGQTMQVNDGQFVIEMTSSKSLSQSIITRIFTMTECDSGEHVEFVQLHYLGWPDHGVPDMGEFRTLLETYRMFREHQPEDHRSLVHCSAGIGRTGTFIAADLMNSSTNLVELIRELRNCRMGMVQTLDQFQFLVSMQNEM